MTLKMTAKDYCLLIDAMEEGAIHAESEAIWNKRKEKELNEWANKVWKLTDKFEQQTGEKARTCN